jgi:molybdopterin-containing oxidoreductase family iron-sulfur binding subunit
MNMNKIQELWVNVVRGWFLKEKAPSSKFGITRRGAIKILAFWSGIFATAMAVPKASWGFTKNKTAASLKQGHIPKWGMVIDLEQCTGCGGCVMACAQENNIPFARHGSEYEGTQILWMNLINNPDPFPLPCMQCEDPPCVKVCPVGATSINGEGLVVQNYGRCIGCRYCMEACPYSVKFFNWDEPEWPGSLKELLNPSVSTRPKGVVEKCTFCEQRIRAYREECEISQTTMKDEKLQRLTACAATCPTRAITFGDLNDPESEVSKLSESPRAMKLLKELGTKPKVTYLTKQGSVKP